MDAYRQGLNGRQAAYANEKYRGHRVIPESVWKDLDNSNVHQHTIYFPLSYFTIILIHLSRLYGPVFG